METMIWSGPFATSRDLAFGSDSCFWARVDVGTQPSAAIHLLYARVGRWIARPRIMFCMRALAFLAEWLGFAHTPVGWACRFVAR